MNSTQSNKTTQFRFSIKYLKSKVVLQIVCLVTVLLAPKLIFFASKSELLFTNLKTLHLARVAMMYTLLSLDTLIPLSSLTCYLSEISGNFAIAVECEIIVILASFGATSFPPLLERSTVNLFRAVTHHSSWPLIKSFTDSLGQATFSYLTRSNHWLWREFVGLKIGFWTTLNSDYTHEIINVKSLFRMSQSVF